LNVIDLIYVGFLLIFLGVIMMVIGLLFPILSTRRKYEKIREIRSHIEPKRIEERKREVEAGGVIIIGPFPIAFGTSKRMVKSLLILSIILMLLAILMTILSLTILYR